MALRNFHVVTGAFGFSGRRIARRLLDQGLNVRTLTNSPHRANPFGEQIEAFPFHFDNPQKLADSLRGASVLYNTYWVRFNHRTFTHATAVDNTLTLFAAAREAGVRRIVHISITNPSEDSSMEYFRAKAGLERALVESGLSYAILRPAVLFGTDDILINNIAWFLRQFPVFAVPASGRYTLQPVYVEDMADIAVKAAHHGTNTIIDAAGPEIYTYKDLVTLIAKTIGSSTRIIHVPPTLALVLTKVLNLIVQDVVLTREEIDGLMTGLLVSDAPPTGKTCLSQWLKQNADAIGRQYASEVGRHYQ
ncbi:MAG: NAD(P)H-binding protein [candidate division NC10 bacterium]|nr:NAD(P)H-binding protein [candidate division NC10 bacterium]